MKKIAARTAFAAHRGEGGDGDRTNRRSVGRTAGPDGYFVYHIASAAAKGTPISEQPMNETDPRDDRRQDVSGDVGADPIERLGPKGAAWSRWGAAGAARRWSWRSPRKLHQKKIREDARRSAVRRLTLAMPFVNPNTAPNHEHGGSAAYGQPSQLSEMSTFRARSPSQPCCVRARDAVRDVRRELPDLLMKRGNDERGEAGRGTRTVANRIICDLPILERPRALEPPDRRSRPMRALGDEHEQEDAAHLECAPEEARHRDVS